ncbi:helix-turn-helix transcriptional regulator [Oceanobacillus sp. CAU 1775]
MISTKTTKDQLLMLIKKHSGITFEEIKEFFSISEPAIRKHLTEMEKQAIIEKHAQKQKIGRPYYTYELTKKGHGLFPNQYESLPVELLDDLAELQGPDAVHALLDQRRLREEEELREQLAEAENFEEKIKTLVQLQNNKGYMVEIEETPEGDFKLTNFNCPISNIAYHYRQVCKNEKTIYNNLFDSSEVIPQNYITTGAQVCKWLIKAPSVE